VVLPIRIDRGMRDWFFFGVNIRRGRRVERLLGFSPSLGELVAAHHPFKKADLTPNGRGPDLLAFYARPVS